MVEIITKKLILLPIIFLLLIPLVIAQENVTPISKEEAERIAKDFLLDTPIPNQVATELAKDYAGSNENPTESNLVIINSKKEETLIAWNFSFKNKEVLIDATSGKLIRVKIKETFTPLGFFGNPFFIVITVAITSLIIVYLLKVLMDKYFKKNEIPNFYDIDSY